MKGFKQEVPGTLVSLKHTSTKLDSWLAEDSLYDVSARFEASTVTCNRCVLVKPSRYKRLHHFKSSSLFYRLYLQLHTSLAVSVGVYQLFYQCDSIF